MLHKDVVYQHLMSSLGDSLKTAEDAAAAAHHLATHEQSKPETQYDTVGLEAGYLAHGQAQRVAELRTAIDDWQRLQSLSFTHDSEISAGALVALLDDNADTTHYLIGNYSGGTKLLVDLVPIMVISRNSPLGKKLLNKRVGEEVTHPVDPEQVFEITDIQ